MVRNFKAIIEKHDDGYVAYPVGLKGVVVAQGDTYEEALEDLRSAVAFHIETFGPEVIEVEDLAHEVFIAGTKSHQIREARLPAMVVLTGTS